MKNMALSHPSVTVDSHPTANLDSRAVGADSHPVSNLDSHSVRPDPHSTATVEALLVADRRATMELLVNDHSRETRVTIRGRFDANTTPEVRSRLDALVNARPSHITVDLAELHQIDSTGVGALVSLFKRIRAYGGVFTIANLRGQPRGIFEILRLDRVFGA